MSEHTAEYFLLGAAHALEETLFHRKAPLSALCAMPRPSTGLRVKLSISRTNRAIQRGGEEERLGDFRATYRETRFSMATGKPHVEHLICFIEHQQLQVIEDQHALLDEVMNTTRGTHHDLGSIRRPRIWRWYVAPPYTGNARMPRLCAVSLCTSSTTCMASSRVGHMISRSHAALAGVNQLHHRNGKRHGLAGTGLGPAHHVATFQSRRNGARLNGRRLFKTQAGHRLKDFRCEAEIGKQRLV